MMSTFKSLHILNYRIWFVGALISNIGTWMQRTAQDWLVFDPPDRRTTPAPWASPWPCSWAPNSSWRPWPGWSPTGSTASSCWC